MRSQVVLEDDDAFAPASGPGEFGSLPPVNTGSGEAARST